MVKINIIEAVQKQINFCKEINNYSCGIYISTKCRKEIVSNVISVLLQLEYYYILRILETRSNISEIIFRNGSKIQVVPASDHARGYRFNGVIVDNEINNETVHMLILPSLKPLHDPGERYVKNDDPYNRLYLVGIRREDVQKANQLLAEKEYSMEFYNKNYDTPVLEKELNGDKVLLYEAWGIPKGFIKYETEFINKTKRMYLNITGDHHINDIGFENDLNVHLYVDTNV